jgi:serine/threonine protein kinase
MFFHANFSLSSNFLSYFPFPSRFTDFLPPSPHSFQMDLKSTGAAASQFPLSPIGSPRTPSFPRPRPPRFPTPVAQPSLKIEKGTLPPQKIPGIIETLAAHDLVFREQIGSGGFSYVVTAYHTRYQQLLAVKIADVGQESWPAELATLSTLSHTHIIQLYSVFQDNSYSYFVLEYCPGGSLADRLASGQPLGFRDFREYAVQLVTALAHCHEKGIAHLDVKPANVLFGADGRVRLADFGCSCRRRETFLGGSMPFMPPEILCEIENVDNFMADIWSLGVTLYCMATGRLPWRGSGSKGIGVEIKLGTYEPLKDVDPRIAALIEGLLRLEPRQRRPLAEVLRTLEGWSAPLRVAMLALRTSKRRSFSEVAKRAMNSMQSFERVAEILEGNSDGCESASTARENILFSLST